mgnify:CR=1 FL=1
MAAGADRGAEATLLFGVGAARSGTSWLYRYLAAHPECHLRAVKEPHFFDSLETGRIEAPVAAMEAELAALDTGASPTRAAAPDASAQRADLAEYLAMIRAGDVHRYLHYLSGQRGNARLVGDMTPAYSLLPVDRLRQMAGLMTDVRFIYLMRDPVARLWSHVRMIARRRQRAGQSLGVQAGTILEATLDGSERHILSRGDYTGAIERLSRAVPAERLFLGFFEELFTDDGLARLASFLGIAPRPAPVEVAAHSGPPAPMTEAQASRAAHALRPQYEYVARRTGRVPDAWHAVMEWV